MISAKQLEANQQNAQTSTGPTTAEGKQVVSLNRRTHGILSQRVLPGEDIEEYSQLVAGLAEALKPVGMMEETLIERLAISLWRQRRLLRAETAATVAATNPRELAERAAEALGYGPSAISRDQLEPPDQEQIDWCRQVLAETEGKLEIASLEKVAPLTHEHLVGDAEREEMPITAYLSYEGGLSDYIDQLRNWCRNQLRDAERCAEVAQVLDQVRDLLAVPWRRMETLTKNQSGVDHQIIKILKALREQQQWRLNSLEAV